MDAREVPQTEDPRGSNGRATILCCADDELVRERELWVVERNTNERRADFIGLTCGLEQERPSICPGARGGLVLEATPCALNPRVLLSYRR